MGRKPHNSFGRGLERLATSVTHWTGGTSAFAIAAATILIWLITGPLFGYSDTWQLIINTGTTIVTFLMVFLIQNSQNRDGAAIQAKLDELIRTSTAQNSFVGIERLTDEEIDAIREKCERRAKAEKTNEKEVRLTGKKAKQAADFWHAPGVTGSVAPADANAKQSARAP